MSRSVVKWLAVFLLMFDGRRLLLNATRVAVIGSGNWGSVIARNVARNALSQRSLIAEEVNMWVYDEIVNGRSIVDIINEDHENVKYLPCVALPENVVAVKDVVEACKDADMLVFVLPHQFLPGVLETLKGKVKSTAVGVSLIKSIQFTPDGPLRCTELIKRGLGLKHTAAVMGANIASDVAADDYVETTVASEDAHTAKLVADIFRTSSFRTEVSTDLATVEFCGALKNIVAIGAGICDGVGASSSSRAALIRQGLQEMATFCEEFNAGTFTLKTLLMSCGVADVIVTSSSGRNSRCGQEYVRRLVQAHRLQRHCAETAKDSGAAQDTHMASTHTVSWRDAVSRIWAEVEGDVCDGQKLQGVSTLSEVMHCLGRKYSDIAQVYAKYPLFSRIHEIAGQGMLPENLFVWE